MEGSDVETAATAAIPTTIAIRKLRKGKSSIRSRSQSSKDLSSLSLSLSGTMSTVSSSSSIASMTVNTALTSPFSVARIHPYIAKSWLVLETELDNLIEKHDPTLLAIFQSMYERGVPKSVLIAIATLSTRRRNHNNDADNLDNYNDDIIHHTEDDNVDVDSDDDMVEQLSLYLAGPHSYTMKLECVRLVLTLDPRVPNGMRAKDAVVEDTYESLTIREKEPAFEDDVLLWELRAKCIRFKDLLDDDSPLEVEDVVKGGEVAAEYIVGAAHWVKRGLAGSANAITGSIEVAGDVLKENLTPAAKPLITPKSGSIALTCTGAARRATDEVRETARNTVFGIRDFSTKQLNLAVKRLEEKQFAERILPGEDGRQMLAAAGKVSLASLGAVAIVGEAIFETTKAVAQKTVEVSADVTRHKFGESAAKVVEDAGETTGNILRTMTHLAVLKGPDVLTKVVAKNTGKLQVHKQLEEMGADDAPIDPRTIVTGTREQAISVVKKLRVLEDAKKHRTAVITSV